jgi:DNA-binding protein H-NS
MTTSYSQIIKQIETLQRQAETARSKEVAGVIGRIKEAIAFYKLTAGDLGLAARVPRPASTPKAARPAKFADGSGNTWGGRGPRPAWLNAALAAGRALGDFAIGAGRAEVVKKVVSKKKKKPSTKGRKVAAKYRDDKGNTWAGRGLKPRWFKDALAEGKTVESMLI